MTGATGIPPAERKQLFAPVIIWLLACAFMILFTASSVGERSFPDPDDVMRLLEVRDWIGGQSWFDVTQYRLNGAAGVPMHWSRLVDVPIAALMLVARPLVGEARAETFAIVTVPLMTLGIAMLLVHRIALKLMSSRAALAAVAATPLSLGAMKQMRPMRIDHHGWQIVLSLVALIACFDERPRRAGLVAGAAMAVWLNISLEGLPFAVAIASIFAFEWLSKGTFQRLEAFLGGLALSSILIFVGTHQPSTWMNQKHDVVTVAYLAGFAAASLSISALVQLNLKRWPSRLAALAAAGAATLCAMFLVDPHWMTGPFSTLDPVVRKFWYDTVDEGLPMWQVDWSEGAMGLAQPLVGLVGGAAALAVTRKEVRQRWAIYVFVLLGVTISSTTVLRIATTASVIAMPGTAFLCQLAYRRARAQSFLVARAISTSAALFLMTPAYAVPVSMTSASPRLQNAVSAAGDCEKASQVSKLRQLPTSEIAAPLDITPAILLNTEDRAVATGHHRNITGMRDTIHLFLDRPASGEEIIKARHVDYVVVCPGAPESIRYAHRGPDGLTALLLTDRPPNWLQRETVPGLTTLKVWRVRKELLL